MITSAIPRSTINTYIHLSILCYSLNSSQFELTNVNFVTNGLPYTAQPPRVRHVTTRTPSSFPLLASQRAGCIVNILSLISRFRVFGGSTQKPTYPFSKELLSYFRLNVFIVADLLRGTEKFAFCSDIFRVEVSGFCRRTLPPARSFLRPRFPRQVRPSLLLILRTLLSRLFFLE